MDIAELVGWTAAVLMLATFACRDQRRLRIFAVGANVGFVAYGILAELLPVVTLHAVLLPINVLRLAETARRLGQD